VTTTVMREADAQAVLANGPVHGVFVRRREIRQ